MQRGLGMGCFYIAGRNHALAACRKLVQSAHVSVDALNAVPSVDEPIEQMEEQAASLEFGAVHRVVYDVQVLRSPGGMDAVLSAMNAGEQARLYPSIHSTVILADASAILHIPRSNGELDALLITNPEMVRVLRGIFELIWAQSLPATISPAVEVTESEPSEDTRLLLTYLAAGLTDSTVARRLEVSERTLYRRLERLQTLLGAQTRFQLGVQAVRRGWL